MYHRRGKAGPVRPSHKTHQETNSHTNKHTQNNKPFFFFFSYLRGREADVGDAVPRGVHRQGQHALEQGLGGPGEGEALFIFIICDCGFVCG